MVKPTPSRFNPDLLARESTVYSVNLPLAQFGRLRELLLNDEGEMHATFRFSRRKNTVLIAGSLKTSFNMQCQRCLEPMQHAVDEPFELVFAKSLDAANAMPEGMDPVVLDEHGQIHVVDLFEDELILHLPTVAKHAQMDACHASEHMISASQVMTDRVGANGNIPQDGSEQDDRDKDDRDKQEQATDKPKPFDVLKNLDLH